MKPPRTLLVLSAGALALALSACSPKEERAADAVPPTPGTADRLAQTAGGAMNKVGDSLATTWEGIKDATFDERAKFQESANTVAATVDRKISELEAKTAPAAAEAKQAWTRSMEELRDARSDLKDELKELSRATEATWMQAKAEVASAWQRVQQAVTTAETSQAGS